MASLSSHRWLARQSWPEGFLSAMTYGRRAALDMRMQSIRAALLSASKLPVREDCLSSLWLTLLQNQSSFHRVIYRSARLVVYWTSFRFYAFKFSCPSHYPRFIEYGESSGFRAVNSTKAHSTVSADSCSNLLKYRIFTTKQVFRIEERMLSVSYIALSKVNP
jgi:hypothetical protein